MKYYKHLYTLLLSLSCLAGLLGQTNKKTLNYQAVILDPKAIDIPGSSIVGQPLNKGNVCLRFSLLNAQGGLDYEETQSLTTDEYGLVNVAIGTGSQAQASNNTSIYKSFESVIWNSSVKSLKVSVSYDGCNSFKQVSAQALNYTPYALYAEAVDYKNVREAPTKLSQFNNDAGYLIPKDLDPLKSDIQTNSSKIEVANKSIADNKQASDATFLVVNQSISSLDTQVAANTTAIKENTSSISNINTKITDQQNQISDNRNQIAATNNNLNTQIGGLQGQLNTTNSTVNSLSGVAEVVSNKSTAVDLGGTNPSDQAYPSQKAAKAYVDQVVSQIATTGVPDATTLAAGKIQLSGDLGGTATSPTVPALAGKENSSNKTTATDLGAGNPSDQLYPSQKATKAYVDNSIYAAVGSGVPDATTNAAGKVKLAGDLAGTAEKPLVAKIQGSPVSSTTPTTGQVLTYNGTSWAPAAAGSSNKEDVSNKSDGALGTSTTLYPTQNAVKTYVDARVASATIADADASTKGKIQLAGDLSGTAESPVVASNAITTSKILDANVTDAKIATVSGSKVTGNITGSAANVTGTVAVANGGTGANTASDALNALGAQASANLSTDMSADAASTIKYPAVKTVKDYVDASVTSGAPDATSVLKGKIALSGDLAGTKSSASAPVISDNAITSEKIANLAVVDAKIAGVAGSKVSGNITGNSANVTGTVAVDNGGTGATTLTGIVKGAGTSALTTAIAGTDYQAPITLTTTGSGASTLSGTTLNIPTGVPYSGATGAVNLGAYNLTVSSFTIGQGKTPASGDNLAIGRSALNNTTSNGWPNIGLGSNSLNQTTDGKNNVGVGFNALYANTTGSYNIGIGTEAARNASTSSNITAIGMEALKYESGAGNTAVGSYAGKPSTSAVYSGTTNSTFIGYNTTTGKTSDATITNSTAIGYGAAVTASHTIQLGNTSVTDVKTSGALTTGAVTYPIVHAGTSGQVLTSLGSGTLTWTTPASSGGDTYTIGLNNNLGGYVVYVTPDGKHGLVAETVDQVRNTQITASGYLSREIFRLSYLATDPRNHSTAGKNFMDWRIPNYWEMQQVNLYKTQIGGFDGTNWPNYFLSISMQGDVKDWVININGGDFTGIATNGSTVAVRTVRSF